MWYVYLLLCADGSLYTGSTNNLEKRVATHQAGKGGSYTRSHLPVRLVYQEEVADRSAALKRELEIKSWNRTEKITRLHLTLPVKRKA